MQREPIGGHSFAPLLARCTARAYLGEASYELLDRPHSFQERAIEAGEVCVHHEVAKGTIPDARGDARRTGPGSTSTPYGLLSSRLTCRHRPWCGLGLVARLVRSTPPAARMQPMPRYSTADLIRLAADRLVPEDLTLGQLRDIALDVFTLAADLRDALGIDLESQDEFVDEWLDEEDEKDEEDEEDEEDGADEDESERW